MANDPFAFYPVSATEIIAASDDTRSRLASVGAVADRISSVDHRRALDAMGGELEGPAENAPTEVLRQVTGTRRRAEFAAGCVEYFGLAVEEHNDTGSEPRSVVKLNQAYHDRVATNFGMDPAEYLDYSCAATLEASRREYDDALQRRHDDLVSLLTGEYRQTQGRLDEKAEMAATMLADGPTGRNVRRLWRVGALPFYAPLVFVDVNFTSVRTTSRIAEALERFVRDHSQLQHEPYLGVLRSIVLESMPSEHEITESLNRLREAGLLEGEPDGYYLEWLTWSLRRGLDPDDMVSRARQEDVTMDAFDPLRELERIQGTGDRGYYLLQDDEGAKDVARLTELLHGGTPSVSDHRRSNNEWTYDGWLTSDSDVEYVLDRGGAIVATPEGTLMAAAGPDSLAGMPNAADVAAFRGGTTYMEMYVVNGTNSDPEQRLREEITDCYRLPQQLLHERLHSEQWSDEGYWQFVAKYLTEGATGDHLDNDFERDAVLEWRSGC